MRNLIRTIVLLFAPAFMAGAVGSWNGIGFTALNGIAQTSWNGTGISCASGSGPVLTYQTNATDSSDLTTYTFAAQAIGNPGDRDYVLVALYGSCIGTPGATISTVTIGGVSATQSIISIGNNASNTSSFVCGIYSAAVPSGTTADIVVTYSLGMAKAGVSVYTIKGNASITPTATNHFENTSATQSNLNTTTPSGNSVVLAAVYYGSGADVTVTWAGLTKRDELYWDSNANASSASAAFSTSGSKTIVAAYSVGPGPTVSASACFQ